jgi:hypothetical protein
LSAIIASHPGGSSAGRDERFVKGRFLRYFYKKVAKKYLFILFFFIRKEPKENRRCANRSLLPAFCLRSGFQGTRNDKPPGNFMRFGEPKLIEVKGTGCF